MIDYRICPNCVRVYGPTLHEISFGKKDVMKCLECGGENVKTNGIWHWFSKNEVVLIDE